MCKFKAERLIKETLSKNHCRFLTSELQDGILIIRYIDARGEYTKNYFPYRFMNEDEIIDMILRSLY